MIELRLRGGCRILLDFSFFAVITLFLCLDTSGYGMLSLAACVVHEMGHLVAMLLSKMKICRMKLYGGGIEICAEQEVTSLFVILAGVVTNFVVFALVFALSSWNNIYPLIFGAMNLLIGLFNLLPLGHLDGYRLLEKCLSRYFPPAAAIRAIDIIERIVLIVVLCLGLILLISRAINFTVGILMLYLVCCKFIENINPPT